MRVQFGFERGEREQPTEMHVMMNRGVLMEETTQRDLIIVNHLNVTKRLCADICCVCRF